jgi:shikimate kinase / 3-dehydroquinate synthase
MNIWLQGPSGAGKSTVGRIVAERLGRSFIDLDETIAREHGSSVADIFWNEGEKVFRQLEWDALLDVIESGDTNAVVALGGGAVADPAVRSLIRSRGLRLFLNVPAEIALQRLEDGEPRPLLYEEDPEAAWRKLYRTRLRYYQDCEATVESAASVDDVATEIVRIVEQLMQPEWTITRTLEGETSTVRCYGSLYMLFDQLRLDTMGRQVCMITDRSVVQSYDDFLFSSDEYSRTVVTIDCGEEHKSLATVERCAREMATRGFTRGGLIVALGGGVVTDVAGFLASIYMRGVEVWYIPTTLLAQVDAAIGGKTAVNASGIRNLLGTVRQPSQILISPAFLRSLTYRELKSGFVEALKMGIANSAVLAGSVERAMPELLAGEIPANISEVIRLSIETKLDVVEQDMYDTSLRHSLNFGHTFGHALEASEPGDYAHGEAVAFGLVAAAEFAYMIGRITERRRDAVIALSLPFTHRSERRHDVTAMLGAMKSDKKRTSAELHFVLPVEDTGVETYRTDDTGVVAAAIASAFEAIEAFQESQ